MHTGLLPVDRHWFLTWTTYGTWLPGDSRGFVGKTQRREPIEASAGAYWNLPAPGLERFARSQLKGHPVVLDSEHAACLLAQFQETAEYRKWRLAAVAILNNHVHLVVGVSGDPDPANILRDFKSFGSRALNARWGKPLGGTWWTESGSRRKVCDEASLQGGIEYV